MQWQARSSAHAKGQAPKPAHACAMHGICLQLPGMQLSSTCLEPELMGRTPPAAPAAAFPGLGLGRGRQGAAVQRAPRQRRCHTEGAAASSKALRCCPTESAALPCRRRCVAASSKVLRCCLIEGAALLPHRRRCAAASRKALRCCLIEGAALLPHGKRCAAASSKALRCCLAMLVALNIKWRVEGAFVNPIGSTLHSK